MLTNTKHTRSEKEFCCFQNLSHCWVSHLSLPVFCVFSQRMRLPTPWHTILLAMRSVLWAEGLWWFRLITCQLRQKESDNPATHSCSQTILNDMFVVSFALYINSTRIEIIWSLVKSLSLTLIKDAINFPSLTVVSIKQL